MLTVAPNVLAARFARSRTVTVALVVGSAIFTALCAQWVIPLPFTPVPVTGQTLAVLVSGATLGMRIGGAGQLLYLAMGAAGLPVFLDGKSGIEHVTGSTIGYLIGFVVAASLVGKLAENTDLESCWRALAVFAVGSAVILASGMMGLMIRMDWSASEAFAKGIAPFLIGDTAKVLAASLFLPGLNRGIRWFRKERSFPR